MNFWKEAVRKLGESRRKTKRRSQIQKHLAQVALYELKKEQGLYPEVREMYEKLELRMKQLGKPIWLVEGFRTAHTQNTYFAKGRTKPGKIVTNAKGLESYHQYAVAFDVAFQTHNWNPPEWMWWTELGKEGDKIGLVWGGSFQDWGHFEWHPDFTWSSMKPYFDLDKN